MKKHLFTCLAVLFLMGWLTVPVSAQSVQEIFEEQLQASGASALYDELPQETQRLLKTLGVDSLTLDAFSRMDAQTVFSALWDMLSEEANAPFSAVSLTLAAVLLSALANVLLPPSHSHEGLFRTVGVLAATAPLLVPLWQTVQRVQAAADGASVFSLAFAPVYAATLAAQGYGLAAVSYQTVMLAASETISAMIDAAVVPLLSVALALGIVDVIHAGNRIGEVGAFVNKLALWLLTVSLTVFVAILSFQGVLSACADSVTGRLLRFSVAGVVPVVGGLLSDALYTVSGCLSSLRGTVGGFGILCTALTVLPTLIECILWNGMLFLAKTVAGLLNFPDIERVMQLVQGILKTMIAVLCSLALLMIIAVTVVTLGGGAG